MPLAPRCRGHTVSRRTTLTGARPVLLTGDNEHAVASLAAEVGISDVRAGLLPQDKVTAVQNLEASSTTGYGGGKVVWWATA